MPPTPFINFAFLVGSFVSIICEIDSSGEKQIFFCCDTGEIGGYTRLVFVTLVDLAIRICDRKTFEICGKQCANMLHFWAFWCAGGTFLVAGTAFSATTSQDPQQISGLDAFLKAFVTAWAILGGPRGSPNRAFWHQVVPKSIKIMSRGYSQKKIRFFI